MKKSIYPLFILSIFFLILIEYINAQENNANQIIPETKDTLVKDKDTITVRFVENMPEFPGGIKEFNQFLSNELRYPENCRVKGISGVVNVEFIIEKNGEVTHVRVITPIHPDLDAEAVRVIKKSPKWTPGIQFGKPVRVVYLIPIRFTLH